MKKIFTIFLVLILAFILISCKENKNNDSKTDPKEELVMNQTNYNIYVGEEKELDYTILNKKDGELVLQISEEDSDICEILDNNYVKGLKAGTCTITVKLSTSDEVFTLHFTVMVPKSLTILNKISELKIGQEHELNIFVPEAYANEDLFLASSDEEVCSIFDNKLIAKKLGTCTITVCFFKEQTICDSFDLEVCFDPFEKFDSLYIKDVLVKNVTSYGAETKQQMVYGSVFNYYFTDLKVTEKLISVTNNQYNGMTATEEMLTAAENLKIPRTGIKLTGIDWIIYHDTANVNAGADATMHANYMVSQESINYRARSWHYTVDDHQIIHSVPDDEVTWQGDTYKSYSSSIGIETCVNYGSDLYRTWMNMGKLLASLLDKYDLTVDNILQHYDLMGKNCPHTLRDNNLYSVAIDLVKGEYFVLKEFSDYNITFTSLCPTYLDNTGKVIAQPVETTPVSYMITLEKDGKNYSKVYTSYIKGSNGVNVNFDEDKLNAAINFNTKVAFGCNSLNQIEDLLFEYDTFDNEVKKYATSINYLKSKEEAYFEELDAANDLIIKEVRYSNLDNVNSYKYVLLYNVTDKDINLKDYSIELSVNDEVTIFKFNKNANIKANSYYTVAIGNLNFNNVTESFATPDATINFNGNYFSTIITIKKNNDILDSIDLNNVKPSENCISRKYNYNINDFEIEYVYEAFGPLNSKLESTMIITDSNAYIFDFNISRLNRCLTETDLTSINTLLSQYDSLGTETKKNIKNYELLNSLKVEVECILNPDLQTIYNLINTIPDKIINNYKLPIISGLTYSYVDENDSNIYDITTGTLKEVFYEYKLLYLNATLNDTTLKFAINVGLASKDEKIIFYTGKDSSNGATSLGNGTYMLQKNTVGFGGVSITVGKNVYLIGKNALIKLYPTADNSRLTKSILRPYGSGSINNCGLVYGVPRDYEGCGTLYYNDSNKDIYFDLSDTYGRNNAGYAGYSKVVFSMNEKQQYYVSLICEDTGQNTTTTNETFTLHAHEYLWCPHTYETNKDYGTHLMYPASSAAGGCLTVGTIIKIDYYKLV